MSTSKRMNTEALRLSLNDAVVLADGEAVDAAGILIDAVAEYLGIDPSTITCGEPLPA
jgi:hypothetical protein